ncbi:hypothetical protein MZO42_05980 [Sphingomonas psychrotolerans]|uniref:Glycoside hydrolase family 19 catalytic domain-containing protein n=1 Tax=Sphingomonas psychrotolerans TaxID=1327635 RepID=A0ABU3N4J6_9SPHN|nr:glycoside hydrolase family 19 protein [Sphingomonas psychrotolerans]MDT8758240.1 hypothetical protein [Sphingomonas psychrotolerans]
MKDAAAFYATIRHGKMLGPTLTQDEVNGLAAILTAMSGAPVAYAAYALATAYHETAHTMQPIEERGGAAYFHRMYDCRGNRPQVARELGNICPGDGARYHGRGYVQLTGRRNYARAQDELGQNLVAQPDLALDPAIAASVMRRGMDEGWFTGAKLATWLPPAGVSTPAQFVKARRIINGTDCADLIADYAVQFQGALVAGGWA